MTVRYGVMYKYNINGCLEIDLIITIKIKDGTIITTWERGGGRMTLAPASIILSMLCKGRNSMKIGIFEES